MTNYEKCDNCNNDIDITIEDLNEYENKVTNEIWYICDYCLNNTEIE